VNLFSYKLHEAYQGKDFAILAQPANMFGYQEPKVGNDLLEEIRNKWKAKFTLFNRVTSVNDKAASPLFDYLQNHPNCKGTLGNKIKLSFSKFLVGKDGVPVKRWGGKDDPMGKSVLAAIDKALGNDAL